VGVEILTWQCFEKGKKFPSASGFNLYYRCSQTLTVFSCDGTRNKRKGLANVRPYFSFLAMVSAAIETIKQFVLRKN
jgi:hypothetical protein